MRDFAGIGLSILCMVHCFGLPFVTAGVFLSSWGELGEAFHIIAVILMGIVSLPILIRKGNTWTMGLAFAGSAALVLGLLTHGGTLEKLLTVVGCIAIVSAHVIRFRVTSIRIREPQPVGQG